MKNNTFVIILLIVLAAGGLWYVKNSGGTKPAMEEKTEETTQPVSTTPASGSAGTMIDSTAKEVIVGGSEFKFLPATLSLKKGETMKLVFKNVGKMPHDFVVEELGVRTKVINGSDESVIEFTPQEAGTFEYYCSVGKHRAMGMKGTLTVK